MYLIHIFFLKYVLVCTKYILQGKSIKSGTYLRQKVCTWYILFEYVLVYQVHTSTSLYLILLSGTAFLSFLKGTSENILTLSEYIMCFSIPDSFLCPPGPACYCCRLLLCTCCALAVLLLHIHCTGTLAARSQRG